MRVHRRVISALLALSLLVSMVTPALAQEPWPATGDGINNPQQRWSKPAPDEVSVDAAAVMQRIRQAPIGASVSAAQQDNPEVRRLEALGDQMVNVVVHLNMPAPVELVNAAGVDRVAYAAQMAQAQAQVAQQVESMGGKVVVHFTTLSSGIGAQIPAYTAGSVSRIPGVARISQVRDYERDLSETVPFIGAKALQDLGVTGDGVKVAVIDSGIDFSHLAFGGPGTVAGWEAAYYGDDPDCDQAALHDPDCAYAQPADPALFGPAAPRIKGGFDWLGEQWNGSTNTRSTTKATARTWQTLSAASAMMLASMLMARIQPRVSV